MPICREICPARQLDELAKPKCVFGRRRQAGRDYERGRDRLRAFDEPFALQNAASVLPPSKLSSLA